MAAVLPFMTAKPVSYETFSLSASISLEVLCEQGVDRVMFTLRVKAVWSCLGLMFSQSRQVGIGQHLHQFFQQLSIQLARAECVYTVVSMHLGWLSAAHCVWMSEYSLS